MDDANEVIKIVRFTLKESY